MAPVRGLSKMPLTKETGNTSPQLVTARTPVGPSNTAQASSVGDIAVKDALVIIAVCWFVVFALYFSLARHNA